MRVKRTLVKGDFPTEQPETVVNYAQSRIKGETQGRP